MARVVSPKRVPTKRARAQYQVAKAQLGQPVTTLRRAPTAADEAYQKAQAAIGNVVQQTPTPAAPTTETKTRPGPGWLDRQVNLGTSGRQLGAPSSAPSLGGGGATSPTFGRYDKGTSARLIVVALGVGGAAIIISGKRFPAYTNPDVKDANGKPVKVPGTLHAFAGLLIAGTVALIVNEVAPDLGMVLGVGLIFVAIGDAQVFVNLGNRIFGKNRPTVSSPQTSTGSQGTIPVGPPPPSGGLHYGQPPSAVPVPGQGPIEIPYGSPSG